MRGATGAGVREGGTTYRRAGVAWLCAWAVALAACGEDSAAGTADDTGTGSGDTTLSKDGGLGEDGGLQDVDAVADTLNPYPNGIGKPCATSVDCPEPLQCLETSAATGDGICSQACVATADCPGGAFCHIVGKQMACTQPSWCDPCSADEDCSPAAPLCVPGKDGKSFCGAACALGDGSCPAGYSCEQYGSAIDDFACRPDYGACAGGGEACAPCQAQADCKPGTTCTTSADTGERACFANCQKDADCASGFSCSPKGFCARLVPDPDPKKPAQFVQTCAKAGRGYCDPCDADWQCASNRCATTAGQSFCVQPSECVKANETKDCADGTFCVPSDKGMICAPPPSWKCQGFKACLGKSSPCGSNETCLDGLCKPK